LGRWQNREALQESMEVAFRAHDSAHWLARLRDCDVPASIVHDYAEVAQEEQPRANGYIVEQEHPRFGKQRVVGLHVNLSETPGEVGPPAPELGADTFDVLREAGISEHELNRLAVDGVISGKR
jgi:crotonobetainyl-CoA:carnitine CoA-transferase CaiB-like acyl-CoA transferase